MPPADPRSGRYENARSIDSIVVRRRVTLGIMLLLVLAACTPVPRASSTPDARDALNLMFANRYSAAATQLQDRIRVHPGDARSHAAYALLLNYETRQNMDVAVRFAVFNNRNGDGLRNTDAFGERRGIDHRFAARSPSDDGDGRTRRPSPDGGTARLE